MRTDQVAERLSAALSVAEGGLGRALADAGPVDSTNPYAYAYGYLVASVTATLDAIGPVR